MSQEGESTLRSFGRIERAIRRIELGRDAIDITGVKSVCAALQQIGALPLSDLIVSELGSEMGRKYGQQGYQEKDGNRGESRRSQPRASREGPRAPRMPGFHKVVRCAMCGVQLPASLDEISHSSQCPKCDAALHSCKHCVYLDPASRFECSQPIPERITPKDSRNSCEFFNVRTTVEKMTTSKTQRPSDSRDAFEDLFKK